MSDETKRTHTEPTALTQLVNHYGSRTAAAGELGVSGQHVSKCLNGNSAPLALELAARHLISKMERETQGRAIIIVKVSGADKTTIEALLTKFALEHKTFNV